MKPINLFLIIISFSSKAFAQYREINQADSIYRLNGVKARISMYENMRMSTKMLEMYDRQGRHIESIYTDTSKINIVSKRIFEYDSTGRIVNEYDMSYYKKDSITKKFRLILDSPVVSPSYKIEYDSLNRIVKKIMKTEEGKILNEVTYTYSPLTEKEKNWNRRDSTIFSERETIYEAANISKHSFGYNAYKNKTAYFDYSYENIFDKAGRLIKRIGGKTDTSCGCVDKKAITLKVDYQYNKNGLLIKRVEHSNYNNRSHQTTLLFDYKFW